MFDRYVESGGNFIDTADGYTGGQSEEMVGKFVAEASLRDRLASPRNLLSIASPAIPTRAATAAKTSTARWKARWPASRWITSICTTCTRWDVVTPVEEVVSTLTDLVRAGKIRYYGFSDTPAWYAARANDCRKRGQDRLVTLQLEYSLVERNIEREHVPVAQELGIGICPWSPLAGGFLAAKYAREGSGFQGAGRLDTLENFRAPAVAQV